MKIGAPRFELAPAEGWELGGASGEIERALEVGAARFCGCEVGFDFGGVVPPFCQAAGDD